MPDRGYLEHAVDAIRETLGDAKKVVLIPFASVTIVWDSTAKNVRLGLQALRDEGVEITAIHHFKDPIAALAECDAIMVNGGNTFNLLHHLRRKELIVPLRNEILKGKPYVGWSAGSGICAPTIRTSNDMPICDPGGFDALGLVPFQINPHYTDAKLPGHGGESRDQRINEFLALNQRTSVIGLREGALLNINDEFMSVEGTGMRLFRSGTEPKDIPGGTALRTALTGA